MKKELEIKYKMDTSDFDKSVESMQKKLKDISSPTNQLQMQQQTSQRMQNAGMGGIMSQPTKEAFSKATQQGRRELEQSIKAEASTQERLGKEIVKRTETLKKLQDIQKTLVAGSKQELEIKEKIARVEENNARQNEQYKQRDQILNQMIDTRNSGRFGKSPSPGLGKGGGAGGGGFLPTQEGMGGFVTAATGVVGAITAIAAATERLTGFPMRLEQAKGSAVANTVGRDVSDVYGGRSAFEAQWMPEREKAGGIAAEKAKWNRRTDRAMGLGGVGLIGAGLATGAASIAGMPFTMGGSALGLGAAGGMIAGGAGLLYNDRNRKGITQGPEYQQLIASQQAEDRLKAYEALKNEDPMKKQGLERFEQTYQKDLQTQRTLGLTDKAFRGEGGFQQRAAQAGFRPEQMAGMAQNIIGAGGSARMGKNAEFGLQMERSGLTNSGQILGSLSNSIQSPEATKRATISIMSEAFKIGLDNTDFAEENRRFTQSAAAIIGRTGATTENDQDRIVRALSMFQGERTNRGVEAAGNAYERSQERGSQVSGRRGAIRFTEAMKGPILSKFDTQSKIELMRARPSDLREDSAFLQSYAIEASQKSGRQVTTGEILQELGKGTAKSRYLIPGNARKAEGFNKDIAEYMTKNNMSKPEMMEASRLGRGVKGSLPDNILKEFGQLQRMQGIEEQNPMSTVDKEAAALEGLPDITGKGAGKQMGKAGAKTMLDTVGERIGDKFNAFNAKDMDEARKAFGELAPAMQAAISGGHQLAAAAVDAANKLNQIAGKRTDLPRGDALNRDIYGAVTQPSANAPKGGASGQ